MEFQYFYSSVARILPSSLLNFAFFANSFSTDPISRLTVLRAPLSSRPAILSIGIVGSALITVVLGFSAAQLLMNFSKMMASATSLDTWP